METVKEQADVRTKYTEFVDVLNKIYELKNDFNKELEKQLQNKVDVVKQVEQLKTKALYISALIKAAVGPQLAAEINWRLSRLEENPDEAVQVIKLTRQE